jgi:hypothetical protein
MLPAVDKFRQTVFIVLVGFIFALYFAATMHFLRLHYPWDSFLFYPADRFMDFFNTYAVSVGLNPYFGASHDLANYFPTAYLFMWPVTWIDSWLALFVFNGIFLLALLKIANYYLAKIRPAFSDYEYAQSVIIFIFLSYPVLFCLDRSNLENLLFVLVAMFFIAWQQKRYKIAASLLALTSAMKLYPLVLITFFIKEKKWLPALSAVAGMLGLTLIALVSFHGGIGNNISQCANLIDRFKGAVIYADDYLYFSTSIFTLLKVMLKNYSFLAADSVAVYDNTLRIMAECYSLLTLFAFALVAFYVCYVEKTFWKQAMLVVSVMVLFPIVSGDYKLIYFFIPFLLFVSQDAPDKNDKLYTLLFALLFIPKNYFLMPHTQQLVSVETIHGIKIVPGITGVSFNNVCNIILLLFFMCHVMVAGMRKFNYLKNGKLIYE